MIARHQLSVRCSPGVARERPSAGSRLVPARSGIRRPIFQSAASSSNAASAGSSSDGPAPGGAQNGPQQQQPAIPSAKPAPPQVPAPAPQHLHKHHHHQSPYPDQAALDSEILSIALPMLATLAADPIAGLVDSAYMGRAGAAQLAAVGVALSVFNTCTKVLNVPLLAVTTSSVAKATGEAKRAAEAAAEAAATAMAASEEVAAAAQATATRPASSAASATAATAAAGGGGTPAAAQVVTLDPAAPAAATPAATAAAAAAAAAASAAAAAAEAAGEAQARAATSCLWLAAGLGAVQAAALLGGAGWLVGTWGVSAASKVYEPALGFLTVRAAGAPITILMLTLQGVYRGLQDTRTPFQATLVSNALNIALAPILIFGAGWGAAGAAAATVAAQAVPVALMVRELLKSRKLRPFGFAGGGGARSGSSATVAAAAAAAGSAEAAAAAAGAGGGGGGGEAAGGGRGLLGAVADMMELFKPTGYLVLRSASVTATYAVATALVARAGAAVTASHQIAFQLWLACGLLADALAVAAQSLMARDLGAGSAAGARQVAGRVGGLSLGLGLALAGLMAAAGQLGLPAAFSSDPEVLRLVSNLFPLLAISQPITVLAMAWDGVLYGAGGFRYAAISMALAAAPAIAVMYGGGGAVQEIFRMMGGYFGGSGGGGAAATATAVGAAAAGLSGEEQLGVVWAGLGVLMLMRWLTIWVPYKLRAGPFAKLQGEERGGS
ncbi:hypothetical protein HYH02_014213 [Chlamydomonas schloesseri]|uniref:Protein DETOXIFICATION n=1 Tax=Chlamydomonas schloesseri TaxID=2026947 RepID=A0A835VXP7_9CHLO|nr:hypothetical protein HYH02_014213 [Chlamydomonas schloesseri]|eukprot:KAG2428891.1 hypothetical protein HYH02_014213 [Chlamydomonas schloesseri]